VRSNITQLIDRLESEKLVKRVDDPQDRRSLLAQITPLGRERQAAGAKKVEAVRRQMGATLKALDADALEALVASLAPAKRPVSKP
jgi:DNA-binding MarR family transcriptional regulator